MIVNVTQRVQTFLAPACCAVRGGRCLQHIIQKPDDFPFSFFNDTIHNPQMLCTAINLGTLSTMKEFPLVFNFLCFTLSHPNHADIYYR